MKPGKIQTAWIKALKDHPERQCAGSLGYTTEEDDIETPYMACCLGELLLVDARINNKPMPFDGGKLEDHDPNSDDYSSALPEYSWDRLGLYDSEGNSIYDEVLMIGKKGYPSLSDANDSGATWTEIAEFVEENLEQVFTKSI